MERRVVAVRILLGEQFYCPSRRVVERRAVQKYLPLPGAGTDVAQLFRCSPLMKTLVIAWLVFCSPVANAGLVAWWKLDDTSSSAIDSSGLGNHGTVIPASALPWTKSFDGSGSAKFSGRLAGSNKITRIYHSNSKSQVIKNTGPFTIAMWFKADVLTAGRFYWLAQCEQYLRSGFRMGIDTGALGASGGPKLMFWTDQSGGNLRLVAPQILETKRWYNVSVVHTGTATQLFLDWQLVATANSGGITRGAYALSFGSCGSSNASGYEFDGEIDNIRINTHAEPPVSPFTVSASDRLMIKPLLDASTVSLGVPTLRTPLGTARGSGSVLIYKPDETKRGTDVFTFSIMDGPSVGERVPTAMKINPPMPGGVPAQPGYKRTVVVHKSRSIQIELPTINPDQHTVQIQSAALKPGEFPPKSGELIKLGSLSQIVVAGKPAFQYQAPEEVGEVLLTYQVNDVTSRSITDAEIVIHSVLPVYFTADPTRGQNLPEDPTTADSSLSGITKPYLLKETDDHTNVIAKKRSQTTNRFYTAYYYEPGVYRTRGYRWEEGTYELDRYTAITGCKHYHAGRSPDIGQAPHLATGEAVLRLTGAQMPYKEGKFFAADPLVQLASGFEVSGLTLDCNPSANPLFASPVENPDPTKPTDYGDLTGIHCFGSNLIIENTRIIGFGSKDWYRNPTPFPERGALEIFPILLIAPSQLPARDGISLPPYKNVIVDGCIVEAPAVGSVCEGVTAIAVGPVRQAIRDTDTEPYRPGPANKIENSVIRNCIVRGLEVGTNNAYHTGGFAALVEDCTFEGPMLDALYGEFGNPWHPVYPATIRRNTFQNTKQGLLCSFLPNSQEAESWQELSFIDNAVALAPDGDGGLSIGAGGDIPAYVKKLVVEGNVISSSGGVENTTHGIYVGFCTANKTATLPYGYSCKVLDTSSRANILRIPNVDRSLFCEYESSPLGFSQLSSNVDGSGSNVIVTAYRRMGFPLQAHPEPEIRNQQLLR